jgi:superfamily II DNA or RNA helicase
MHQSTLPLTGDKRFSYFKLNESLPPTKEQADEQEYIRNTITDSNYYCGVVNMKTGRGKTHLIFWLIEHFKVPTLILCHNIKQAHETFDKLKAFSNIAESDISCITSKSKNRTVWFVTVTTHTWFVQNFEELYQGNFKQIIYDECDYNLSFPERQDFDWCMSSCLIMSGADYLRWMTGTPYRHTIWNEPLIKLIGPIIHMPDQDLNWYNILPHIYQCYYYDKTSYERNTWSELRTQMFENDYRILSQLHTIKDNLGTYNLLLLETIKECNQFYFSIDSVSLTNTIILHGQLTTKELREQQTKLAEFRDKWIPYIIVGTIDMMWRGIDIPEIDTVFLFAPVKFEWTVVQAIWRALRSTPNKPEVKVYDWLDLPLLTKQATARRAAYKQEYWADVLIDKLYIKWIEPQN